MRKPVRIMAVGLVALMLLFSGSVFAKTVITMQHMTTIPQTQKVLDEAIAKFQIANPDVEISQTLVGWGDAHAQFTNSLIVGMAPDIVLLGGPWAPEFQRMGAFAPIDEYVSADVMDNFLASAVGPVSADGHIYGLPWEGATWGMFYRKDLFEAAGLDPNRPPQNWDELLEYALKLTTEEQHGLVFPAGSWEATDYFMPFMWQAGNPVEQIVDGVWQGSFSDESGLAAAQFYVDLIHKHGVTPASIANMDWEDAKNAFVTGNAAMMFNGMWVINVIKESNPELDGKWGTAMYPAGPGGRASYGYPNYMHIPAQSKNKEVAGKFLEFLADSSEGISYAEKLAISVSSLFWTKSFIELPYAQDELIAPFAESLEIARFPSLAPAFEEFRELYLNPGIQGLILETTTPEEFVKDMDDHFNQLNQ